MTKPPTTSLLTERLKKRSRELGFTLCGVTPAVAPPGAERLQEWLERGYAGEMRYLAERREAYAHPEHVLSGVRSVVMLALPYQTTVPARPQPGEGRVSRYAWGEADYHDVIRNRMHTLADALRELTPEVATRCVVDTAPLLEREFAQLAGLGWIGKNTLLLNRTAGSYFFLAALLTDATLDYDQSFEADHCGSCTACLEACPTDAFPQPYVLDASRCISYLTIEHRSAIPSDLRPGIGDWLFGCDICQEVCPWNSKSPRTEEAVFQPTPTLNPVELAQLFDLDEQAFRQRYRKTPLWRPHRRGLLRSAATVLGNQRDRASVPALAKGLADDEPLVRGACAWALGRIGGKAAIENLQARLVFEADKEVRAEIQAALAESGH